MENGERIGAGKFFTKFRFPGNETAGGRMADREDFGVGGGDFGEETADGVEDLVLGQVLRRGEKIHRKPGAMFTHGGGAAELAKTVRDRLGVVEIGTRPVVNQEHGALHAHDVGLVVATDGEALAAIAVVEGDAVGAGGDLAEDGGVEVERFAEQEDEGVLRAVVVVVASFAGESGGFAGQGEEARPVAVAAPCAP